MHHATDEFDPTRYLPPPPAPGSPRAIAEIAEIKQLQAAATPDELALAAYDDKHEDITIFAAVIGPGFDPAQLPATVALTRTVQIEEEDASDVAKKEFHRPRPWIVEPSIQTCTPHKPGPAANSYPSGHATVGFAMAEVLATLLPEKAGPILARATLFAENRLVCGYHFRSDVVAGQQFGTVLAMHLMHDKQFEKQMDAAKAELRQAHLAS
jgi:acid phosphatase (class A)